MFKKHIVYICFVMVSFLYLPALGGGCVVGGNIGPPDGLNQNNGGEKSISDARERTPAEKTTEAIAEDKGDASAKEESPTETAPEKETDCARQTVWVRETVHI